MTCPGCQSTMTAVSLAGQYGRTIVIDVCHACNHVWFDGREDLHLAPGGVVTLFQEMGRAAQSARTAVAARKACPRCQTGLLRTRDRVKDTPYEYFRCTQDHGRFLSFGAFLRARQFVRDLTDDELKTLRVETRILKCVNCGASVDISAAGTCDYCQAPVAVLDGDQLSRTLKELEVAEAARATVDPTWPLRAEQARRQTEAAFAELRQGRGATPDLDLVEAGLGIVTRILRGL